MNKPRTRSNALAPSSENIFDKNLFLEARLQQLFFNWLLLPESQALIEALLDECDIDCPSTVDDTSQSHRSFPVSIPSLSKPDPRKVHTSQSKATDPLMEDTTLSKSLETKAPGKFSRWKNVHIAFHDSSSFAWDHDEIAEEYPVPQDNCPELKLNKERTAYVDVLGVVENEIVIRSNRRTTDPVTGTSSPYTLQGTQCVKKTNAALLNSDNEILENNVHERPSQQDQQHLGTTYDTPVELLIQRTTATTDGSFLLLDAEQKEALRHLISNVSFRTDSATLVTELHTMFSINTHPAGISLNDMQVFFQKCLKMSKYLALPVFNRLKKKDNLVPLCVLVEYAVSNFFIHDANRTFFNILSDGNSNHGLCRQDFEPFLHVIADEHPGLDFLKTEPHYQRHYIQTVGTRLLYALDDVGTGIVTMSDLYKFEELQRYEHLIKLKYLDIDTVPSDMLADVGCFSIPAIWASLDTACTTTHERMFFSYEHFYVIYYLFCELDSDHDFFLGAQDLLKYDQHALSLRLIERVVYILGSPSQPSDMNPSRLTYDDFIVFLMNEENKTTSKSLTFWFNVVDLDGDGFIKYHEMNYFYEEQCERLEALNQETIPLKNIICQFNDLIQPSVPGTFTLKDFLRHRRISGVFFDMLLNLTKALSFEFRDPYQARQEIDEHPWYSTWDRFALREYYSLITTDEDAEVKDAEDTTSLSFSYTSDDYI